MDINKITQIQAQVPIPNYIKNKQTLKTFLTELEKKIN
jgi:ribosomal protein S18